MKNRPIEWHASIDTTMRRAAELASSGCPTGAIVGADEQTAGQGRLGRNWISPPGSGLYFTMVLRPKLEVAQLPLVTLALGLAVADTLQMFAGVACDLRWPNDVMVNGRKLAGILAQFHDGAVLAGIGVNISQSDFPAELHGTATSLTLETGTVQNPRVLLYAIAGSIETHVRILETSGATAILRLFESASTYASGMPVTVDMPRGPVNGVTAGLTAAGFLKLRTGAGETITITAGGIRPQNG